MWWLVASVLGWSQITTIEMPTSTPLMALTQTDQGVCLFVYINTTFSTYYWVGHGVIDPTPLDYTDTIDMAIAKSGNATVWMDVEDGVSSFYVYDLHYTQRVRFVPRASPNPIYATGLRVAMDQTGNVIAMTDDVGNVYVQEWHNNAWHNISSSFTVEGTQAFGRLLRVVSFSNTIVVGTTYLEGYDSYAYVCVNDTEWNCTIVYVSESGINMDMSEMNNNWTAAIGDYGATEGGVLYAGHVVVKGALSISMSGTDITTGYGSAVSITSDWLAVATLGPAQYVLVYERVGSHYTRVQTVPLNQTVNYIAIANNILAVTSDYTAFFFEPTTPSPTFSPTWYPTVASSVSGEAFAVSIYALSAVILLMSAFFIIQHSTQRQRYHQMTNN